MAQDPVTQTLQTLGRLYETAFSVASWAPALDGIATLVGGNGALLFVNDQPGLRVSAMSSRYRAEHIDQYVAALARDDELRWVEYLNTLPPRSIVTDGEIWPDRTEYDAMPSVNFMRDLHLYHRAAVRPCAHGGWHDALTVLFDETRKGISTDERGRLSLLVPHIARAIETQRPFMLLHNHYHAVLSMLDRLGIGVVIVQERGIMVTGNREAHRILEARDGLLLAAGSKVQAQDPEIAAKLAALVQRATRAARLEGEAQGGVLQVPRRSGSEPYLVDCEPLRDGSFELGAAFTGALLILIDPDHREVVSVEGLARSYHLTAAETAVCHMIAQGMPLPDIASARNVSVDTVKSQSRSIYGKTRTHNRRELVRRALSIVPPLLDQAGKRIN